VYKRPFWGKKIGMPFGVGSWCLCTLRLLAAGMHAGVAWLGAAVTLFVGRIPLLFVV
jgi:hypothetical protein